MFLFQTNILQWEHADPPWVLPAYVSEFSCSLDVNQTWIVNGGSVTVPSPLPRPSAGDDGESEVMASDVELPSP